MERGPAPDHGPGRGPEGALLHAANFSVGVHLFLRAARELARSFQGRPEFVASIQEEHHAAKLDAPSGTALLLQRQLGESDPARSFPITSVRAGTVPGTHTLTYEGPHETVTLSHVARTVRPSLPAPWPPPSGCRGRPGSSPSRTCSSEKPA